MNTQLTPWFSKHVKPARSGIYIVQFPDLIEDDAVRYSYWDGYEWYIFHFTPTLCMFWYRSKKVSTTQDLAWRGLTKESK